MLQLVTKTLYVYQGQQSTNKIFGTDLDSTLARSKLGRFHKNADDWAFLPNRIVTLKTYIEQDYTIVIFTNQKRNPKMSVERINNVLTALLSMGINPWVFVATGEDKFRKPSIGMWKEFIDLSGADVDFNQSFYTGDAAGRPCDHADVDLGFAENIGLNFFIPEAIFPNDEIVIPKTQTMFIFVGMPGSGKSTYYEEKLKPLGWIHASQDKLKTAEKVLSSVRQALINGKSVAVDATNPGSEKRKQYIELAAKYNVPTLIIYFVRDGYCANKLRERPVPDIAYSMYFKNLEEPKESIDGVPVVEIY